VSARKRDSGEDAGESRVAAKRSHRKPRPEDLHNIRVNTKALRATMGWSQEQLGQFSGVGRSHVGRIEAGKWDVGISTLGALAETFKVRTADLLLPTDPKLAPGRPPGSKSKRTAPK